MKYAFKIAAKAFSPGWKEPTIFTWRYIYLTFFQRRPEETPRGPRGPAPSAGQPPPEAAGQREPPGRDRGLAQSWADPGRRARARLTPQAANGKPRFFRDFASRRSNCPINTQEVNGSSRANVGGQMSQSTEGRCLTNEIKELAE